MRETPERRRARGGWYEDLTLGRISPPFGPRNTVSNLAYAIVGVLVAATESTDAAAVFAVAMIILATGSALYHAEKTLEANRLDWLGMFAVFGAMVPHGWLPNWPGVPWLMLGVAMLLGWLYLRQRRLYFDWAMGVLLVLSSIRPVWTGAWAGVAVAWAVFAVSYGLWRLDKAGSRWVGLWGHAAWHVGSAVALGLLFSAQSVR